MKNLNIFTTNDTNEHEYFNKFALFVIIRVIRGFFFCSCGSWLNFQRVIVAEIEAEQALVEANHELIARMEKKIKAVIERVWGNDSSGEIK